MLLDWVPMHGCGRKVGHPHKRWRDDIEDVAGGGWARVAQDPELWQILGESFQEKVGGDLNGSAPELKATVGYA